MVQVESAPPHTSNVLNARNVRDKDPPEGNRVKEKDNFVAP